LDDLFQGQVDTVMSNSFNINKAVSSADLLIGAVLLPGSKAPTLVTEEMVKQMKTGSVIVDVAVDQGGCIETVNRVTTHDQPIYTKHGVLHYCVANMPGAVPHTSTLALTNVTMPYIHQIANNGTEKAIEDDSALRKGVNVSNGEIVHEAIAQAFQLSSIKY
jgi:alanine dehydrogenase